MEGRNRLIGVIIVVAFAVTMFAVWRAHSVQVQFGQVPSAAVMPDDDQRKYSESFHAWLVALRPDDATRLKQTGDLMYSWDQLNRDDPVHAHMADEYVESMRARFAALVQKDNRPLSPRLAAHHYPETVEFKKFPDGCYYVVIRSAQGIRSAQLEIARPL